jgi:hypothetical protein
MNVIVQDLQLHLNWSEATDIYMSIRSDIRRTIDTHWAYHAHCWPKDEGQRLSIMRSLAGRIGQDYENDVKEFNAFLAKRLEELKAKP